MRILSLFTLIISHCPITHTAPPTPPQTLDQVYRELTSMASLSKILSWRKSSSLIFLSWKSSSIWAWASSSCCRTLSMWLMELLWGVLLLEMAESLQERQCKLTKVHLLWCVQEIQEETHVLLTIMSFEKVKAVINVRNFQAQVLWNLSNFCCFLGLYFVYTGIMFIFGFPDSYLLQGLSGVKTRNLKNQSGSKITSGFLPHEY